MRRVAVVILMLALAACTEGDTAGRSDSSLACDHFRNIAGDIADGVLTDSEIRSKLREVESNASIATPAIQSAARRMLAAATQGDTPGLTSAAQDMGAACEEEGV